jgi:hypothetical protein
MERNAEVRISRRWLTVIAAAGGLLIAASPATTAQAAVGDSSQICLTNAPSYCIHSNGTGNQVSITNVAADKSNFTVVYDSDGYHAWQNGNGNCLREGTGGVVKIENGPCNITDHSDLWWHSQGGTTWYNDASNYPMYTKGDVSGDYVWTGQTPLPSGSWSQWNAPT